MITNELPRGAKIYWKRGDSFTTAYFLRIHDMPQYKALTVKHASGEIIIKDEEAFTEKERFQTEYNYEIQGIRSANETKKSKKFVAQTLDVPYSRILRVAAKCNTFRIPL